MGNQIPTFRPAEVETLCKVLADTHTGLTGSEIGHTLRQVGVRDTDPNMTKWKRLYNALVHRQNHDGHGDRVLAFISEALDPARYHGARKSFERRRQGVNTVLAYHGLEFCEDGKFHRTQAAATLSEAEQRANRLKAELDARGVHDDVLRSCRSELLEDNCFHAVLEATKGVAEKIRDRTGLDEDGVELAKQALSGQNPMLRINSLETKSERSEQRGFLNLTKGLFGVFRNPTAHEPRIEWEMKEGEALDLFTLASYVHRRVDDADVRR